MDEPDELTQQVWVALMYLAIHLGMIDLLIATNPLYADARSGWELRKQEIRDWSNRQVEEINAFGEAYDS